MHLSHSHIHPCKLHVRSPLWVLLGSSVLSTLLSFFAFTRNYLGLWKVKSLSYVRVFAIPWTVVYQASLSKGFSRQEYWSGLPFPSPGDLPNPRIESRSPALPADAFPSEPPGSYSSHQFAVVINIFYQMKSLICWWFPLVCCSWSGHCR